MINLVYEFAVLQAKLNLLLVQYGPTAPDDANNRHQLAKGSVEIYYKAKKLKDREDENGYPKDQADTFFRELLVEGFGLDPAEI